MQSGLDTEKRAIQSICAKRQTQIGTVFLKKSLHPLSTIVNPQRESGFLKKIDEISVNILTKPSTQILFGIALR